MTGPTRSRSDSYARDLVRLLQRERDVVEPFEQPAAALGVELERHGTAVEADLERLEVDLGAAGRHQRPTSSSGSTTGSRPIFVQLEKKMSAKLALTTAWKP